MNRYFKYYNRITNYLATHNRLSFFLSHGGLHLAALIILLICGGYMIYLLHGMSGKQLRTIDFALNDTLKNYHVNLFKLEVNISPEAFYSKFNGNFKKSPTTFTKNNLLEIFPWRSDNYISTFFDYSIESWIDNCPDDSLSSHFIYPQYITSPALIRHYLKNQLNNLRKDIRLKHKSEQTNADQLYEITRNFLVDKLEIYDTVPSEHAIIYETHYSDPLNKIKHHQYPLNRYATSDGDTIAHFMGIEETVFSDGKRLRLDSILHSHEDYLSFPMDFSLVNNVTSKRKRQSPYINCLLHFDVRYFHLTDNSEITINFDKTNGATVYEIKHIYPTPSHIGVNCITYTGNEAVEQVLRDGSIYIAAEDVKGAYYKDRIFTVISVLFGTLIAFVLDITIQLIYKWRKLKWRRVNEYNTLPDPPKHGSV